MDEPILLNSIIGPLELLIIQASPFCNINCSYCYLTDRSDKERIKPETVLKIFERIIDEKLYYNKFTFLWHAGEPTTVPINLYEEIFSLINEKCPDDLKITHSFQTNGTLLNQNWCDFFKKHNCRIGVSIDGPKHIHDKNRLTRSGKGTFDSTLNGIDLLKLNNISFSTISVVTAYSLNFAQEIFTFFKDLGSHYVAFNIDEAEGIYIKSTLSDKGIYSGLVKKFWRTLYQLNLQSDKKIEIREFELAKSRILQSEINILPDFQPTQLTGIYKYITVDYNGNFSTFSPELLGNKHDYYEDFILGNVYDISFRDALKNNKFRKIFSDISKGVELCKKTCEFYGLCLGGSPSNKLFENGSFNSSETQYCHYVRQLPIEVIVEEVEKDLNINTI
jgi:uncharacterized protein